MSVQDQLQRAYQLIRAGSRQDAIQVLMPVLRADPANADAWWLLANAVTDPAQKKRALEEVLKLRPTDERARKMLDQVVPPPPPPPPPPSTSPFDLDDDVFNSPPDVETLVTPVATRGGDVMPNWSSAGDTPATVSGSPSPMDSDPFGSSPDPFGTSTDPWAEKPKNDQPPMTTPLGGYPAPNVPPAPVYMGPPPRKGPSCCLIFTCLFVVLFCILPLACTGAGLAGLSPVFNQVAATLGANDFQGLINVFSGQATPLPGSALDDAFNQMGVENFGQLQGTLESFATLQGTPGLVGTLEAAFNLPVEGQPLSGSPVSKGNIEPGQTVSGTVQQGSVGDGWIISLNAGQTVVIDAEGGTNVDTTLALVGPDNLVVAFNDDGGGGTDAQLTFTAGTAGKYTIVVGSFANQGGSYTLTVQNQ